MEAKDPSPEKDEKLTFFRTLKEDSSASKHNFVPFKPAQDTPPPLEAVASKEVDEERPEAPRIEPRAEEPAPEAAPKASFHYYVGVAAFQFRDNAHRLTEELKRSGYPAYAVNTKAGTKPHRVRVGPFQSFREANGTAHRIEEVFLYPSSVFKKTRP
jgi:cell division septation protein DedD